MLLLILLLELAKVSFKFQSEHDQTDKEVTIDKHVAQGLRSTGAESRSSPCTATRTGATTSTSPTISAPVAIPDLSAHAGQHLLPDMRNTSYGSPR